LPLGQCHRALLESENIVGEVKANVNPFLARLSNLFKNVPFLASSEVSLFVSLESRAFRLVLFRVAGGAQPCVAVWAARFAVAARCDNGINAAL
jgi:hypothetical protein